MRLAVLLSILAAFSAFAGYSEFGIHGGLFFPTGDAGDDYNTCPEIGGQFLMHMPMYAIEASLGYVFLQPDLDIDDYSGHIIPVMAGLRTYSGTVFYGGGLELDAFSVSYDISPDSTYEASESDLGAYGNLGTTLPLGGTKLELSGKLHWMDFDDMWLSAQAGIYF
ncbi:MAG TPA: hypothetical protein P5266_07970 [Candidatus Fermentibacter sp.]|nr:hypothetical protein [Candidatus Fermentibacter sp.]